MKKIIIFILVNIYTVSLGYADTLKDLSGRLDYLAQRDKILSRNIANSDTPKYLPKDLKADTNNQPNHVSLFTTNQMHFNISEDNSHYSVTDGDMIELKPNGNGVSIEHELMKKSENALELQEISNLYMKTRNMLRTSITGVK